jgi:hypothetical protein
MSEAAGMATPIGAIAGVGSAAMPMHTAGAAGRRAGASERSNGLQHLPSMGDMGRLARRSDILLAVGVMGILVVLVFPVPPILLDLLLAVSIIVSVLILMTSLFIEEPLEFSVFPTVLLVATMLRLALNMASTRLILAHGHEGTAAAGPRHRGVRPVRHGRQLRHRRDRLRDPDHREFRRSSPRARAASPRSRRASPSTPCRESRWRSTPIFRPG